MQNLDRFKRRIWLNKQLKPEMSYILFNAIYNNEGILMNSIGLRDKNGYLIYEGDIIEYSSNNITNNNYLIVYQTNTSWYLAISITKNFNHISVLDSTLTNHCKIIGNMYENPQLLPQHDITGYW